MITASLDLFPRSLPELIATIIKQLASDVGPVGKKVMQIGRGTL